MDSAVRIVHAYAVGVLLVVFALLAFAVFTLVDTARRPAWQWARAGANKTTWVVLEAVFLALMLLVTFFAIGSVLVGIVYFSAVRPRLEAAGRQGPSGPGPEEPRPPAPVERRDLPPFGWYPDPSGRHQQRYWDGTRWTDDVSDDGQQASDPQPGG